MVPVSSHAHYVKDSFEHDTLLYVGTWDTVTLSKLKKYETNVVGHAVAVLPYCSSPLVIYFWANIGIKSSLLYKEVILLRRCFAV